MGDRLLQQQLRELVFIDPMVIQYSLLLQYLAIQWILLRILPMVRRHHMVGINQCHNIRQVHIRVGLVQVIMGLLGRQFQLDRHS